MLTMEHARTIQEQTQRLKERLSELYVVENGQKQLKPGVSKAQLQAVLMEIKQISSEYDQMAEVVSKYRAKVDEHAAKVAKTKSGLLAFERDHGVKFPEFIRNAYRM